MLNQVQHDGLFYRQHPLITQALKQHETVGLQSERLFELEDEIARLKGGRSGSTRIKASVKKPKDKTLRKRRTKFFARGARTPTEVVRHVVDELFPFARYPEIPSENNAAERAVRPAVIARKVSGRTRLAKGSKPDAF